MALKMERAEWFTDGDFPVRQLFGSQRVSFNMYIYIYIFTRYSLDANDHGSSYIYPRVNVYIAMENRHL